MQCDNQINTRNGLWLYGCVYFFIHDLWELLSVFVVVVVYISVDGHQNISYPYVKLSQ